jgi:hypothetical protein
MIDAGRRDLLRAFAMLVMLTATLCLGLFISAGRVSLSATVVILLTNWASALLGTTLFSWISIASSRKTPWLVCWLTGVLALCLFILAASLLFDLSAGTSLLVGVALSAILTIYRRKTNLGASFTGAELATAALVCLATVVWSWRAIQSVPELRETGIFYAWSDYFIHASEIVQFANLPALHEQSIFAAGAPLPIYHYASYMLPAAIVSLTGLPALVCATSLWTPLGFLVLGFGAFALGNEMEESTGGLASITAVLLLPDAAWYGLKNPFLDFHWLLQISSSGAFAVGLALLSLKFLRSWATRGGAASWVASALSALLVAPFRVHIAVLIIPAVAAGSLCYWRMRLAWKAVVAAGLLGLTAIGVFVAESIQRAPHFLSDPIRPLAFLRMVHAMQPNNYASLFTSAESHLPQWLVITFGAVLFLLAAFGILLPLYLLFLVTIGRRSDALPLMIVLIYLTVVLLFPTNQQEPEEFQHRPFVLVYAVLAIWCAVMLLRWVSDLIGAVPRPRWLALPVLVLLPFPLLLSPWSQQSRLEWGPKFVSTMVPPGLQLLAGEIRRNSATTSVIAAPPNDLSPAFSALSERAMFLPGDDFLRIQSGLGTNAHKARETTQAALFAANRFNAFRRLMCNDGINLVAAFPDTPLHPNVLAAASWKNEGYLIISDNSLCQPLANPVPRNYDTGEEVLPSLRGPTH